MPEEYDLCPDESKDLCEKTGWNFKDRKSSEKGFLYCCSPDNIDVKLWFLSLAKLGHTGRGTKMQLLTF